MPTPIFPSTLPNVSMRSYSFQPVSATIRTEMEVGLARVRRRFVTTPTDFTVKWQFTRAQLAIFEKFFDEDANAGASWFYIKLVNGMGENTYLARFKEEAPMITASGKEHYWDVTAKLETLERPLPA